MNIVRTSENTVLILFDQVIDADHFALVNQSATEIKQLMADSIIDIVIAYSSIHITFNLMKISGIDFIHQLQEPLQIAKNSSLEKTSEKIISIPVYYGEDVALDLAFVAKRAKLSPQDVIDLHTSNTYDVYAIGFAPGFAYLGNVDPQIATPRKETPRKKIARGSVGIADQQTAIYPSDSPGGWQIIGITPLQLIDYQSPNLTQFTVGDKIKFYEIDQAEYRHLSQQNITEVSSTDSHSSEQI